MTRPASAVRVEHLAPGEGPPTGAFARALRSREGDPLRFLDPPPADDAGWAAWLEAVAAAAPRVPADLAEALARRQVEIGAGPKAESNARALADEAAPALAVVTGQQPGLLGGSLLTFHKAAGAIALAERLTALGGRRVVPIFWLASEDHDLDEANDVTVLDRRGQPRRLRLDLASDGRSVMDVRVDAEAAARLTAALAEALPDTERGRAALALAASVPGEDFAAWAARAMAAVFGDSGLVVLEPPVLTAWVGETYAWLLDHAEPIRDAIAARGAELEAAGLPAPLAGQPADATPLFLRPEVGGRRLRVGVDGERVTLRDEPADLDRAALRRLLLDEPLRASGNVVGRVFVQDRHLPVVAYVAGPTEVAYWAQLRAAHEAVGLFFPLALPRPEATWTDAKTDAALAAFDMDVAFHLRHGPIEPPEPQAELPPEVDEVSAYLARFARWAEDHASRAGEGARALMRSIARMQQAWEKGLPQVRAAFDAEAAVARSRLLRALDLLAPRDRPQERVLSPLVLVARHGLDAVRAGLRSLDPLRPAHHVVHLGEGGSRPPTENPA